MLFTMNYVFSINSIMKFSENLIMNRYIHTARLVLYDLVFVDGAF